MSSRRRIPLTALSCIFAFALAGCAAATGASDGQQPVTTGTRLPPIIYRPPGLSRSTKVPLLVAFRGAGAGISPQNMEGLTHFEELARTDGFVTVIPDTSD